MKSVLDRRPNIGIRSTRLATQNSHVIRVPELSATPPKRCNSNDAISKLEIRVGELRATFLRNHSSVPHSGVVLPNRCNACGALLPRLFLLSGGNCYHRAATRRRHAVTGVLWSQNPPDECWVVRWIVGVVLNVQSTSAGCAEKGVFGAKWTTL